MFTDVSVNNAVIQFITNKRGVQQWDKAGHDLVLLNTGR